jgi:hypothetical protein
MAPKTGNKPLRYSRLTFDSILILLIFSIDILFLEPVWEKEGVEIVRSSM